MGFESKRVFKGAVTSLSVGLLSAEVTGCSCYVYLWSVLISWEFYTEQPLYCVDWELLCLFGPHGGDSNSCPCFFNLGKNLTL